MDTLTRDRIADSLATLADQKDWNLAAWQECYELVKANLDNEIVGYVYDDVIHYSGEFNARNIFCVRVQPSRRRLERYNEEFRQVAVALRLGMTLGQMNEKYNW